MRFIKNSLHNKALLKFIMTLVLFLGLLSFGRIEELSLPAYRTLCCSIFMVLLWIFECFPLAVTSLLPIFLFPLLEISSAADTTKPYAHPVIFLFLGGFFLAISIKNSGLDKRIASLIIRKTKGNPKAIMAGFISAASFISLWINNTATVMILLPMALSLLTQEDGTPHHDLEENISLQNFGKSILLALSYGSSIGGMGTIIGCAPNAFLTGFMSQTYNFHIDFTKWMIFAIPIVFLGSLTAYFIIDRLFLRKVKSLPVSKDIIESSTQIKPLNFKEKYVLAVFFITVGLWLTQSILRSYLPLINNSSISIFGASLLFLTSVFNHKTHKVISWKDTKKLPWGVLLLFGGGLTLASQIQKTGLATWIGEQFYVLKNYPLLLSILIVIVAAMIMTEFTSNTAVAAALIPIVASVSVTIGYSPLLLSIPLIFTANSSFMLPIATPPNAIVYGTGFLKLYDMAKAGFFLKIFMTLFILAFTALFAQLIFGI